MDMKDEFFAAMGVGSEGFEGINLTFVGNAMAMRLKFDDSTTTVSFTEVGSNRVVIPSEIYQYEIIGDNEPGLDMTMENIYQETMKSGIIKKDGIECSYDENNVILYYSTGLAVGSLANINGKYYEIVAGNNKCEITTEVFKQSLILS